MKIIKNKEKREEKCWLLRIRGRTGVFSHEKKFYFNFYPTLPTLTPTSPLYIGV